MTIEKYTQMLQECEQQINQLSVQRERIIGALAVLQEQSQAEAEQADEPEEESTED